MPEVIVLKPRRNNSPFTFKGVTYPQIVDELGVVRLEVDDPEFLKFMSENPDTFEVPADVVTLTKSVADGTPVEEPVVAAAAEEPVAVVPAVEESVTPEPAAPVKGSGKRASRLNG